MTKHNSFTHRAFTRPLLAGFVFLTLSSPFVLAQDASEGEAERQRGGQRRERPEGAERRNFDPTAMRDRMMGFLRERLEITDDAEWAIIQERMAKVIELRPNPAESTGGSMRALAGIGGRGQGGQGGQGGDEGGRGGNFNQRSRGANANPELVGLVQSLRNQASESEIIDRLEKLRAARNLQASKLTQAQEDLRIVLTPRQEAIAVLAGLLP